MGGRRPKPEALRPFSLGRSHLSRLGGAYRGFREAVSRLSLWWPHSPSTQQVPCSCLSTRQSLRLRNLRAVGFLSPPPAPELTPASGLPGCLSHLGTHPVFQLMTLRHGLGSAPPGEVTGAAGDLGARGRDSQNLLFTLSKALVPRLFSCSLSNVV